MVSNAAYVVDHQSSNRLRVEHAPGAHPVGREHLGEGASEGTTEPGAERHAKALFSPGEDLGREAVGHRFLEQPLEPEEPSSPQGRGDAAHELDEGVVEERGAQLEAGRHAGTVRIGEVLPGEVELAIPVDQARGDVPGRAVCQRLFNVDVWLESRQPGTHCRGQEGPVPLGRHST